VVVAVVALVLGAAELVAGVCALVVVPVRPPTEAVRLKRRWPRKRILRLEMNESRSILEAVKMDASASTLS